MLRVCQHNFNIFYVNKRNLNEEMKWFCFSSTYSIIISLALGGHMILL